MKYADVRPEIEELYDLYVKPGSKFHLSKMLFEMASLEELYQKLEDHKVLESGGRYNYIFFHATMCAIADHKDPSSIPILLRFCNDEMYEITPFQEGWLNAFHSYPEPELFQAFFSHLDLIVPKGLNMMSEFITSIYLAPKYLDLLKKCVLLAKKDLFITFFNYVENYIIEEERDQESYDILMELKDYYLANYMRVVSEP